MHEDLNHHQIAWASFFDMGELVLLLDCHCKILWHRKKHQTLFHFLGTVDAQ